MAKPQPSVVHHAWVMERDYDDPHRGRIVALGPKDADPTLVQRLLIGEGVPFVLRDSNKYPLYSGRYIADRENDPDGPFSDAPLIEYGSHIGAAFIDYSTREV